jgi:uncharacterized peroxidase-related enzyme
MAQFQIHTPETASPEGKEVLERAQKRYGFVPNLIGGMVEAPAAADAYMAMGDLLGKTSLTPSERHVAWFTANFEHGCDYCMAAHSAIATAEKIPADVIESARSGKPYADAKLEALRAFTLQVVRERGWVNDGAVDAFLEAGFTKQNVLEVVLVVAHKVLSNYTNHIVGTPVDQGFKPFTWEAPRQAAE